MQVQVIRSFVAACVLASTMRALPADESVLFANYNPSDQPNPTGWRIGATTREEGLSGYRAMGILVTPTSSGYLERIEVVLLHESGGHDLTGYLLTDASGLKSVIARVIFSVPDSTQPQVVSARVVERPAIRQSERYWFVLESANAAADSIFWARREGQPATSVVFGNNKSAGWRVQPGTFGAMLRLYGEATTPSGEERNDQRPRPPAITPVPTAPPLSLDSLIDQKLILVHVGDNKEMRLKKSQLASLGGNCDVAVQVREATRNKRKVKLRLENIGAPARSRCTRSFSTAAIEISGFKDDESPESVAASVAEILRTPEQYLADRGITFNLAPGQEDEPPLKSQDTTTPARPLLTINGEFSEEARRAKHSGSVMISLVIGSDGRVHQAHVLRGGEMGLGESALRVLPLWRFEPARKAGQPVASQSQVEMTFNLY